MAPRFITFEGLDGSGKSTHLRWVARTLDERGIDHLVTHEPGGTTLGESIREVFLDPRWGALDGTVEALLVFASRRQHLLEVVDPALAAGRHVLCDRFTDSTYAYQGFGRGVELEILDEVDRLATGNRRPDRTLLFDVPAKVARNRGNSQSRRRRSAVDRLDAEELQFYERVREGYLELVRREPDRFRVVTSAGSTDETAKQVRQALAGIFDFEEKA